MSINKLAIVTLAAVAAAFVLPGCVVTPAPHHDHQVVSTPVHVSGPPPHAPAHGYRHKHKHKHKGRDVELVYNTQIGVYIVAGHTDTYWHDDVYFRFSGDNWVISTSLNGPWGYKHYDKVPGGLHKKYKARTQAKRVDDRKGRVDDRKGNVSRPNKPQRQSKETPAIKEITPRKSAVKATGPTKGKGPGKSGDKGNGKNNGKGNGRGKS